VPALDVVVIGLSLSSSWGNGHATTYRALLKAFAARGHKVLFLERDVPWYSGLHRDMPDPDFCELAFYRNFDELRMWGERIAAADAVIVGSYVPEGVAVGRWVQRITGGVTAFYDIDTPVTLAKLARGDEEYLSPALIPGYDLYLSFTGGPVLEGLMRDYGSPAARPLYCSVDTTQYSPVAMQWRWDLSYLGTFSSDRQPTLERLLLEPARRAPELRFAVAGPQYPDDVIWPINVERLDHVPPTQHAAFYSASRYTLNVTRQDMIRAGYSPSVRLFEAAACGTPIISDVWAGIESFFEPGREIMLADKADDVLAVLREAGEAEREAISIAARRRVIAHHTADHRAVQLEKYLFEPRPRRLRNAPASPQPAGHALRAPP
jgi:spore maturation protein CgeB